MRRGKPQLDQKMQKERLEPETQKEKPPSILEYLRRQEK